tara:strand:- start:530 stop:1099 length:570 start_codon:yes stop_codon:yes gene_type:complete
MSVFYTVLNIVVLFLLADFTTGIYHFFVDTYGVFNSKFLKKSVDPLLLHHIDPLFITKQSYWQINGGMYVFSCVIFCASLFLGFYWELFLFLLFCSNGNLIHKWSHVEPEEVPEIGKVLQKLTLIQTKEHHAQHHTNSFMGNYCVMSNYLNPILRVVRFWELIIKFLKLLGVEPVNAMKQKPQEVINGK